MLNIVHVYQKARSEFGRQTKHFTDSEMHVLCDIQPDASIKQKYIINNPRDVSCQCVPEKTEHDTNTSTIKLRDQGMNHLEGGWPKDVDVTQAESKHRHVKKEIQKSQYKPALVQLSDPMEHFLKQNSAIDIYEMYFEEKEEVEVKESETNQMNGQANPTKEKKKVSFSQTYLTDPPRANMISVLKDPSEEPRTASHISWLPGDGSKIAVSFAQVNFDKTTNLASSINPNFSSYIWDLANPNAPDCEIQPTSPLYCLEFNPKDSNLLVGGCYNGVVALFDTRNDSNYGPILESNIKLSHREPIYDVRWIQSKNSTLFLSVSTDGLVNLWDTRNMDGPVEKLELLLKEDKNGNPPKFKGLLGSMSLHYNATHSAAKFMVGTEQGAVVACTRRKNKPTLIDRSYFGHHGPIYSVMRNPFIPKYFLTIGDWTAKVWEEETMEPIISTPFHDCYLTSGCWSNSRAGVFYTTKSTGDLDIYDLYHNQNKPIVSLNVSNSPLHCIRSYNGERLAVGAGDGTVTIVELSNYLSGFRNGEKAVDHAEVEFMKNMFDREAARERNLLVKRREREAAKEASNIRESHPSRVELEDFPQDFEDSHVPQHDGSTDKQDVKDDVKDEQNVEEDEENVGEEEEQVGEENVGEEDDEVQPMEEDKIDPVIEGEEIQDSQDEEEDEEDEEQPKEEEPKQQTIEPSTEEEEEPTTRPRNEAGEEQIMGKVNGDDKAGVKPATPDPEAASEHGEDENPTEPDEVEEKEPPFIASGELSFTIVSVKDAGGSDLFSKPDLYIKYAIGDQKGRTKTVKSNRNPTYNQEFSITVNDANTEKLEFVGMEDDFLTKDDVIGHAILELNTLQKDQEVTQEMTFVTKKKSKKPMIMTIKLKPTFGKQ
eukprot:CAMPEP_0117424366 /NCGR_PEP_ID=MMETSP0758-20121206/4799_1 /TAXON_ID=63605 /ORGANISM="Percolomonas cosmopolitus, Strain AE-1 (ATCC 50343)" /LENGTH=880 /DNA_ID=CAMNT_0005208101 /DNA_START=129 /DNA_END=2771 /DNA_ORIENTATION=-